MRRARTLSEDDKAVWDAYVNGAPRRDAAQTAPIPAAASPMHKPRSRPASPLVTGQHPPGLDRGTWQRFRTGRLAPERTLDLHGKTAAAAHTALRQFLHEAHARQTRCVEIITGKGSGEHGGIIRRELPLWLNDAGLRALVLATAHPHAANAGAVILLLRRKRQRVLS